MSKLAEAAKMADIRAALLNLLLNLSEEEAYTIDEAIEDIKDLLREVESVQYPFE
jgi:hypothetical protein